MSDEKKYDKARELSEKALDAMVDGDEKEAAKLVEQAKKTDAQAVQDVVDDLAEDEGSEHDPEKLKDELAKSGDKS